MKITQELVNAAFEPADFYADECAKIVALAQYHLGIALTGHQAYTIWEYSHGSHDGEWTGVINEATVKEAVEYFLESRLRNIIDHAG